MARKQSPQPAPAGPSQLKGFLLGIVAAAIVVALVLAVLRWRDPGQTTASPVATAPPPQQMQPQGPPPAPMFPPMAMASAPRISIAEAKDLADRGEAVFIDVRDIRSYEAGHIPGALQIPLDYVQGEIPWFPGDRMLIPYCTWPAEEQSARAALILQQGGKTNTAALVGGMDAWREAGYPIETGLPKPTN